MEQGLQAVSEVRKTPAHRTKEEAIAQDDEDDWYGNDKADYFTKHALAGTGKDGLDYKVARHIILDALREISSKLAEHLNTIEFSTMPRARGGSGRTRLMRSEHHFARHLTRWVCLNCGCSKCFRKI